MKIDKLVLSRMEQLIERGEQTIDQHGKYHSGHQYWSDGGSSYSAFFTSTLSLLTGVFGEENVYQKQFQSKNSGVSSNCVTRTRSSIGVLKAAKEDYENGYLFNTKSLIEAEVFDDFLEQAEQLFAKGYYQPAAVVAGCVLEDGLKKLCVKNGITLPPKATMNPANDELAKAGVYNTLTQKKVLAMADLRNKAAHGHWNEFTKDDVGDMIKSVRSFLETHYV